MKTTSGDDDRGNIGSAGEGAAACSNRRDEIALAVGCMLAERDAFHELVSRYFEQFIALPSR